MRRRDVLAIFPVLAPALLTAGSASARDGRPVVVELFTSQGCSSCPPADAVLAELARTRADVLPLSLHVTYWNRLGWRDPFSLEEATERQRRYAGLLRRVSAYPGTTYTPQAVIGGRRDVVGSERGAVLSAIGAAIRAASEVAGPDLRVGRRGGGVVVEVGDGVGAAGVWVVGYDPAHATDVGRGENAGRRLTHANVVRGLRRAGAWRGAAERFEVAAVPGERLAALVQAEDGAILAAAVSG